MSDNESRASGPAPSGGAKPEMFVTKAGLRFVPPAKDRAFGSLGGKRCWGQLLEDPAFVGLDAFQAAVDDLEDIVEAPAGYKDPTTGKWVLSDRAKAILGVRSGKVFSFASEAYVPVQDREVARPMLKAAAERGLHPFGRIDGQGTGRTRGHVLLANPDFTVRLLEDYPEDIMLGIRWWNSATTDTSFGAELFGVRTVCVNYNLWGSLLGEFRVTHRMAEAEMVRRYAGLLEKALDASDVLSEVILKARALVVVEADVPDLLWGVGLPKRGIDAVAGSPTLYAPEIREVGLNAWSLYNAATAYITYRPKGGRFLTSTESHARGAVDLLTASHDRLIEKGREARKEYEERLKEAQAKRTTERETMLREKVLAYAAKDARSRARVVA